MFGAADGLFGEERGVHVLAIESASVRRGGRVASFQYGESVEGGVFVEFATNSEDSGWCKPKIQSEGGGRLADCRRLNLGCGVRRAKVLRLVLKNINQ